MTETTNPPGVGGKQLVLLAVCLAAMAMPLAFTGPAVALLAIGHAFGGSPIALNWVTNGFMLAFASSLMATGALADGYGRKRVFLIGVAGFTIISLALALAPNLLWFDLLRAAQGLAAAAAFSGGVAALAQEFEGPKAVRAFSLLGTSFGVGLAFGPISSGLLVDAFGWRTVFVLVATIAALGFALGLRSLRESRDPDAAGLDWPGAISFTGALSLFTYGVLKAPESGWSDPMVIGLLVTSVLLFAAFVVIEGRVVRPMLDVSLFRYPRFVGVQLLAAAPAYAFVVLLVLLPIRFIGIEGMTEVEAGRSMLALSAPLLILPVLAGMLTRWFTPATICGTGLLVSAGGLVWLSFIPAGEATVAVMAPMLMIGVGISLPWGLMDGLAVSVVPKERAGMATGIFSTVRVAGEGVALAVVTAVLSALTTTHLSASAPAVLSSSIEAAQRLATGDLAGAAAALPQVSHTVLIYSYGEAFGTLLVMLSVITVLTAVVIFLFLGRGAADEAEAGDVLPAEAEEALSCAKA